MGALREILASFGFEVDDTELKKGEKAASGFEQTVKNIGAYLAGGAIVNGFKDMVMETIDLGSSLNDTSAKLGISAQELQKFQFAGQLAGVSAEEMSGTLNILNRNIGNAAKGGDGAAAFTKLGIKLKDAGGQARNTSDIFVDIAEKVGKLGSQGEKTAAITGVLGRGGASLLPLFAEGSKGVQEAFEQFKKLGLAIDDDFIKNADEAGDTIDTFKFEIQALKTKLVGEALPTIKEFAEMFLKVGKIAIDLSKNTNFVKVAIAALTLLAGGAAIAAINGLLRGVGLLSGEMSILDAEVLLPLAALAALALIIEDVYTLFTGGDSVIGEFIDSLFGVGASKKFVQDVKDEAVKFWEVIKTLGPPIMQVGQFLYEAFMKALPYIKEFVAGQLTMAVAGVKELVSAISKVIVVIVALWNAAQPVFGFMGDQISRTIDFFKTLIGYVEKAAAAVSNIPGLSGLAGKLGTGGPTASTPSGGGVASVLPSYLGGTGGQASVNQDNKTTINISGSNAQQIGTQVQTGLGDTFEQAKRSALNAVKSVF